MNLLSMKHKTFIYISLFLAVILFGCSKKEIRTAQQEENISALNNTNSNAIHSSKRVNVSNLDELYAAVNDADNAGATIIVAPGTYMLSADYPKAGLLELLHDMSLSGQPGHPESVIIDASNLPDASFIIPGGGRKAVVRIGDGYNSIVWLTLQNNPNHPIRSLIATDLIAGATTKVRVANSIIKGSAIGINLINSRTHHNNRVLEAEIANNEIFDNTRSFSAAIQIQNSQNVQGASIKAMLRGNLIHDNRFGVVVFTGQAPIGGNNQINVTSTANRIENNGLGISLEGGVSGSSNNSIVYKAFGDKIRNNRNIPEINFPYVIPGGVYIAAGSGMATDLPGTANNNQVEAHFHDCIIEDNIGNFQMNAFGGRTIYPSPEPVGINNTTKLYLYGLTANIAVNAVNSIPAEPAGTNTVNVYRLN